MHDDDIARFWRRLGEAHAGFLGTLNGAARMVPMCHQLRERDATLWFITARDTDLAEAVEHGPTPASYLVAEEDKGLFAVIEGDLMQRRDTALRDELWTIAADSWFVGGKSDPQVCILAFVPRRAETWLTPTSGLSLAFNILRAQVTGERPDIGRHGTLSGPDLTLARVSA